MTGSRDIVRKSFILSSVLAGICCSITYAPAGELRIGGYGNAHYMDHAGMPRFHGQQDFNNLNHSLMGLREFSLFIDVAVTDAVVVSIELEVGDQGTAVAAN